MTAQNLMQEYLSAAVTGSLIIQRARQCGFSVTNIDEISSSHIQTWVEQLTDLGISSDVLASHSISTIIIVLSNEKTRENFLEGLEALLWEILGDPSSGNPPAIYRKAAFAIWLAFLVSLDPEFDPKK